MKTATEPTKGGGQGGLKGSARRFARDCSAATAVEYAVMTFIAIAIVVVVNQLGIGVAGLYDSVAAAFN
jgi:Flp pilus assembly pilin Flp